MLHSIHSCLTRLRSSLQTRIRAGAYDAVNNLLNCKRNYLTISLASCYTPAFLLYASKHVGFKFQQYLAQDFAVGTAAYSLRPSIQRQLTDQSRLQNHPNEEALLLLRQARMQIGMMPGRQESLFLLLYSVVFYHFIRKPPG